MAARYNAGGRGWGWGVGGRMGEVAGRANQSTASGIYIL